MKMEVVSVYKKKYKAVISDVDFAKKLKLSSLFTYFQDIASLHAENLGLGFKPLEEKYGVIWVLIRIRVDIVRYPLLNEEIVIESWPQEPGKIEFNRDFLVWDSMGNIIARAVSSWVIIDKESRKIKKSELIYTGYPLIEKDRAIDCKLGKFEASGKLEAVYKKVVGYSDIDFNEHLNNSRYIDFIMDCFDLKSHKKYEIKSIEVSYNNEALPGDSITLCKDTSALDSNMIYIEGINEKDNNIVFKSKVEVEKKIPMKKYDTVIFDLDGTLLNTLDDLTDSVNYALGIYGFPCRGIAEVKSFVGNGVGRLIELSIPDGLNNPHYEKCLADFRNHYSENMRNKTAAYKEINEVLEELSNKGYKLAIVSNKFDTAVKGLNEVYFGEYVKVAIGESEDVRRKPAPDSIFRALEELSSTADKAIYVGDSEVDVKTAKNSGIICVGVTWGFRGREVLEQEGADYIIDSPQELLKIVEC